MSITDQKSSAFGDLLKRWRQHRRLSQEELAGAAEISARHVSFLETGRAQPSREMIALLAHVLDLPLAERNTFYNAIGLMAPYLEQGLATDDPQVRAALEFILRQQEPFPGLVVDGHWDVLLRNDAALAVFGPIRHNLAMEPHIADNAMHVVFHPNGLRPFIVNWREFGSEMLRILHREATQGCGPAIRLLEEILRYPDLPTAWRDPTARPSMPITPMRLQMGELVLSFITTFTAFAMPADAKLEQVKLESFFPADKHTALHIRARGESRNGATHAS
jgi:transcriptional regulator with XRE-family HTH domain